MYCCQKNNLASTLKIKENLASTLKIKKLFLKSLASNGV